jgi:hypothetical protein
MAGDELELDLHHVVRPPIPWRSGPRRTECGLDAERHPTWERDELVSQARRLGRTRIHLLTCMTCLQTAERHPTWDEDPVRFMGRLVETRWSRRGAAEADLVARELRAMAALVAAHQGEFDGMVQGLEATADLASARRARSQRG